jgi:hypothetical protein
VDGLEVRELVIVCIDAGAKEETSVAAVDDLVGAKLDEVGLVFLIALGDQTVDLALELDLLVVAVGGVPLGEAGFAPGRCGRGQKRASVGRGVRVRDTYCRFWMRIKDSIVAAWARDARAL